MIPASFEYHRPESVEAAVKLIADFGDSARVLAGGHSLIPMMKLRLATPEDQTLQEFTVLLTVQVMNYLHSGRHRVAL